ncbi:hypothetical protein PUN28_009577 [Cardiocondyla obscurior]|uniref:Uncharacterized protein n=1 Tax=Cardiocondyla obscurior TaxID=286306 RepID=A0AAW2FV87_9HYME
MGIRITGGVTKQTLRTKLITINLMIKVTIFRAPMSRRAKQDESELERGTEVDAGGGVGCTGLQRTINGTQTLNYMSTASFRREERARDFYGFQLNWTAYYDDVL